MSVSNARYLKPLPTRATAPLQRSQVTGQMKLGYNGPLLGEQTVLLYDGATAVPTRDPMAPGGEALYTLWRFDKHVQNMAPWQVFVCCGPAAPFPAVAGDPIVSAHWWPQVDMSDGSAW